MDWFISGNVEHFPGMMVYNSVADLLYSGSTEAVFSLSPVAQASKQTFISINKGLLPVPRRKISLYSFFPLLSNIVVKSVAAGRRLLSGNAVGLSDTVQPDRNFFRVRFPLISLPGLFQAGNLVADQSYGFAFLRDSEMGHGGLRAHEGKCRIRLQGKAFYLKMFFHEWIKMKCDRCPLEGGRR